MNFALYECGCMDADMLDYKWQYGQGQGYPCGHRYFTAVAAVIPAKNRLECQLYLKWAIQAPCTPNFST
jgi:hypothetical protein